MLRSGELDTIQVVVLCSAVLQSSGLVDAAGLQFGAEYNNAVLVGEDGALPERKAEAESGPMDTLGGS